MRVNTAWRRGRAILVNRYARVLLTWVLGVVVAATISVRDGLKVEAVDPYARTFGFQLLAFCVTWLPWMSALLVLALVVAAFTAPPPTVSR